MPNRGTVMANGRGDPRPLHISNRRRDSFPHGENPAVPVSRHPWRSAIRNARGDALLELADRQLDRLGVLSDFLLDQLLLLGRQVDADDLFVFAHGGVLRVWRLVAATAMRYGCSRTNSLRERDRKSVV